MKHSRVRQKPLSICSNSTKEDTLHTKKSSSRTSTHAGLSHHARSSSRAPLPVNSFYSISKASSAFKAERVPLCPRIQVPVLHGGARAVTTKPLRTLPRA